MSAYVGNSTHTETPSLSENEDCAMAALPHFITRLKDSALEKTSSGRKKKFWLAPAFLTINPSKATNREDLGILMKILTKNWLLHLKFVPLSSYSWERLKSGLFPKG